MIKFKKILFILFFSILFLNKSFSNSEDDIYLKIDLFSEVLDKINKEYVDEVNQSESNGCCHKWCIAIFRSLLSLYVSQKCLITCKLKQVENLVD